jgi:hypothetical protein
MACGYGVAIAGLLWGGFNLLETIDNLNKRITELEQKPSTPPPVTFSRWQKEDMPDSIEIGMGGERPQGLTPELRKALEEMAPCDGASLDALIKGLSQSRRPGDAAEANG